MSYTIHEYATLLMTIFRVYLTWSPFLVEFCLSNALPATEKKLCCCTTCSEYWLPTELKLLQSTATSRQKLKRHTCSAGLMELKALLFNFAMQRQSYYYIINATVTVTVTVIKCQMKQSAVYSAIISSLKINH